MSEKGNLSHRVGVTLIAASAGGILLLGLKGVESLFESDTHTVLADAHSDEYARQLEAFKTTSQASEVLNSGKFDDFVTGNASVLVTNAHADMMTELSRETMAEQSAADDAGRRADNYIFDELAMTLLTGYGVRMLGDLRADKAD